MMPQSMKLAMSQSPRTNTVAQPQADAVAQGRQRFHAPSDDEDKALDGALNALARDLGVELED